MVRRGSTVRVRQRASPFSRGFLYSASCAHAVESVLGNTEGTGQAQRSCGDHWLPSTRLTAVLLVSGALRGHRTLPFRSWQGDRPGACLSNSSFPARSLDHATEGASRCLLLRPCSSFQCVPLTTQRTGGYGRGSNAEGVGLPSNRPTEVAAAQRLSRVGVFEGARPRRRSSPRWGLAIGSGILWLEDPGEPPALDLWTRRLDGRREGRPTWR
jgi:hypothetical protein